jgi:hypothetical protein
MAYISKARLLNAAIGLSAVLLVTTFAEAQLAPGTTDARAVLTAMERQDTGDRAVARLRMTITGSGNHRRERTLSSRSMRFAGGTKTLLFVESPADMRGTGLLSIDQREAARDDEQWLYLPSVHRATRIGATGRSGAFLGSDFSYGDLTVIEPDDFEVRMLDADAVIDGEPTWQIEATPRNATVRQRVGYTRLELWVSKRSLLPIRSKGTMAGGRMKYIALMDVRAVAGVQTAHRLVARTVHDGRVESETVLERLSLRYGDTGVTEADFTVPRLERGP